MFELEIVSITQHTTLNIEWLEIESPTGSFFIGPSHSYLISLVKPKSTFIYKLPDQKEPETIEIFSGIFKVNNNKALLVLE
jgi:F0F1-type ATP synthase epsilon subunit